MHNWIEMYVAGREKVASAIRRAQRSGRERTPAGTREPRPASLILSRGEVLRLGVKRGYLRLTCRTGRLWATSDQDGIDSLLMQGQSVTYRRRGTVVIEALRTATLCLESRQAVQVVFITPMRPAFVRG